MAWISKSGTVLTGTVPRPYESEYILICLDHTKKRSWEVSLQYNVAAYTFDDRGLDHVQVSRLRFVLATARRLVTASGGFAPSVWFDAHNLRVTAYSNGRRGARLEAQIRRGLDWLCVYLERHYMRGDMPRPSGDGLYAYRMWAPDARDPLWVEMKLASGASPFLYADVKACKRAKAHHTLRGKNHTCAHCGEPWP